jgi:soluble lytic murein transglycosylase-like protein
LVAFEKIVKNLQNLVHHVVEACMELIHNGFALVGIAVLFSAIALIARPDLRETAETQLVAWLQQRQFELKGILPGGVDPMDRATARSPSELSKSQAALAYWLSKKYRVAKEPLSALVTEAHEVGKRANLDPTLILAVMAIESGFNPFAESPVGAQGLMQVVTKVHRDKYETYGGHLTAFDPVTNLRVGVKVLQECIKRGGSVEMGLRLYVGAANLLDDGGYVAKVLAEHGRLQQVASGQSVPYSSPNSANALSTNAPDTVRAVITLAQDS